MYVQDNVMLNYHYTSRPQTRGNQLCKVSKLSCMTKTKQDVGVVSLVIHARGMQEVHVRGTGHAP